MKLRVQPFNAGYNWFNTTANLQIADPQNSVLNAYKGGVYQQVIAPMNPRSSFTELTLGFVRCFFYQ